MTAYPDSKKYSADVAPRVPALKLSMKRTVCFSSGTVVPPEVTRTTRLFAAACWFINDSAAATCFGNDLGGGLELKYEFSTTWYEDVDVLVVLLAIVSWLSTEDIDKDLEENRASAKLNDRLRAGDESCTFPDREVFWRSEADAIVLAKTNPKTD